MEKDNKIIYSLLAVIICLLIIIIILLVNNNNNKLVVEDNETQEKIVSTEKDEDDTKIEGIDYESYKGKWCREYENDIIIKDISKNSISFSWSVYRTFAIDEIKTKVDDNIAKFYYKAYVSPSSKEMTNNQVTIKLDKNKLIVEAKKIDKIDNNYELINDDRGLGNLPYTTFEYTRDC